MITQTLNIDKRDIQIISLYMEDPHYSQADIAKKLKLSQPSINSRINKLKKKGILNFDVGIDLNRSNLMMARVDLTANKPDEVLEHIKKCSFFVNGFRTSGERNISILFCVEDFRKIDTIVTKHLRSNPQISNINTTLMMSSINDFLFKLDLTKENTSPNCYDIDGCKECANVKIIAKRK